MLRKDIKMRIARDMRGKITSGNRNKDENEHPKSLPYFNLGEFPELQAIYGDKPERILVVFPTDNIEDFYSTEYSLWGTGKGGMKIKKRSCDGETCLDCITREESPCLCAEMPERECKCYMSLKAFVVNPTNGLIVNFAPTLFESHSVNTADAIYRGLEIIYIMTGGKLKGIPFVISVEMVEMLNEKGNKTKFPIWKIQVATSIDTALRYAKVAALPTTEENRLAIDATIAVDAPLALSEGNGKTPTEGTETGHRQEQPENKGNGKPENSEPKTQAEKIESIRKWILTLSGQDQAKAKQLLFDYTSFTGKDGNEISGVYTTAGLEKFSEKRLNTTYGKIKKDFDEAFPPPESLTDLAESAPKKSPGKPD